MPMNSFSAKSDEELACMAANDDQEAFACLLGRFSAMIYAKAVAKSRQCGCDVTDDMAQEAAIGILNAVRSYHSEKGASFRTYAERCVDNVLTSAVRSYFSGKNTVINEHSQLNESSVAGMGDSSMGADPEWYVLSEESKSAIFAQLSETERDIVELRLSGMSYEETAKALGLNVKTVDNAIQRVRKKFRSAKKD